jgi:hypothetical protein
VVLLGLGAVYLQLREYKRGLVYAQESIKFCHIENDPFTEAFCYITIASSYKERKQQDSCIYYAKKAFETSSGNNEASVTLQASTLLSEQYEGKDIKEAHFYRKIAIQFMGRSIAKRKNAGITKNDCREQERQRQTESEQIAYQNQLRQNLF